MHDDEEVESGPLIPESDCLLISLWLIAVALLVLLAKLILRGDI